MNGDEKKGSFRLDYSAPTDDERREIESIRGKYLPQKESATKMDKLRALDAKITSTETTSAAAKNKHTAENAKICKSGVLCPAFFVFNTML